MHGSVRASLPLSSSLLTITSFLRRVAELEQENARLLALSSSLTATQPQKDIELVSEVQQLREQLAALKERERTLSAQLASSNPVVKIEDTEPSLSSTSRSTSTTVSSAHKSGASLGLMASAILGPFVPYVSNIFFFSLGLAVCSAFPAVDANAINRSYKLRHSQSLPSIFCISF